MSDAIISSNYESFLVIDRANYDGAAPQIIFFNTQSPPSTMPILGRRDGARMSYVGELTDRQRS